VIAEERNVVEAFDRVYVFAIPSLGVGIHQGSEETLACALVAGLRHDRFKSIRTEAGVVDLGSLPSLVAEADAVISVCPPAPAVEVAEQVSGLGFGGLYVDVNAVPLPRLAK
jgi:hypothetical protein